MATCSPPPGDWTGERVVPVRQGRCPGMQAVLGAKGPETLPGGALLKLGQGTPH